MNLNRILFNLYILFFPFYFFSAGNPQISDIFGFLLIISNIHILLNQINKEIYLKLGLLFVFYALIVNIVWSIILTADFKILLTPIYYIYCFMFVLFLHSKKNDLSFWKSMYTFLSLSVLIQLICYFLFPSITSSIRATLFFNNPNQLSLWAICMCIIIYVLSNILQVSFNRKVFLLLCCSFLVVVSNSIAGMVTVLLFWVFFLLNHRFDSSKYVIILSLFFIFYYQFSNFSIEELYIYDNVYTRFESDPVDDNTLKGRGLDRIWNDYQYLVFGAGEGQTDRFTSDYSGEIHSTIPNILFGYGIIGFFIYLYGIYFIVGPTRNKEIIGLLVILLVFSSAHMTLRIPFFWMSLYIIFLFNKLKIKEYVWN